VRLVDADNADFIRVESAGIDLIIDVEDLIPRGDEARKILNTPVALESTRDSHGDCQIELAIAFIEFCIDGDWMLKSIFQPYFDRVSVEMVFMNTLAEPGDTNLESIGRSHTPGSR
jgi:hypothetical protein